MGLTTGPVPARVDASVKVGLLALVDYAVAAGWPRRRACHLLQVETDRVGRWAALRDGSSLGRRSAAADEEGHDAVTAAVLAALTDGPRAVAAGARAADSEEERRSWRCSRPEGGVDRSHRKLAHRGSRLNLVSVSASPPCDVFWQITDWC